MIKKRLNLIGVLNTTIGHIPPKTQEKRVIPSLNVQNVVPDTGYAGLSKVTVEAVTNKIDNNIVAENIKKGVNILGVEGTFAGDKPDQTKEITPTKQIQTVTPDKGYELSQVTINPIPDEYVVPNGTIDIFENGLSNVSGFANANINITPLLQSKSVTPNKENQVITHDVNYDGLESVNVAPIPNEYITPTGKLDITENGEINVNEYAKANVNVKYKPRFISFYNSTLTDLQPEIEQIDASLLETLYNAFLNSVAIEIDLSSWNLSSLTVMYGAFRNNTALERLDLGNINVEKIANTNYMCNGCSSLKSLIIRSDGVLPLTNINALSGTPIASGTGYVYVSDNLVNSYKSETNWSNYASQIKPISEYVEEV